MAGEELERAKRKAVALRYDKDRDQAPKMIAKGRGHLADRIVALAREQGIHVHHDPDLVALLAKLEVQSEIPGDLYQAIAEVLAFVYRLNDRMKE